MVPASFFWMKSFLSKQYYTISQMKTYYGIPISTYMSNFISPVIWTTIRTKSPNKNKLLNSLLITTKIHWSSHPWVSSNVVHNYTTEGFMNTVTRVRMELQHLHNCNLNSEIMHHQHYHSAIAFGGQCNNKTLWQYYFHRAVFLLFMNHI